MGYVLSPAGEAGGRSGGQGWEANLKSEMQPRVPLATFNRRRWTTSGMTPLACKHSKSKRVKTDAPIFLAAEPD